MSDDYCTGCGEELNPGIDADPDGTMGATCARCLAEESHDFDRFPNVRFARDGRFIEMTDLTDSERQLIELLRECMIEHIIECEDSATIAFAPQFSTRLGVPDEIVGHYIAEAFYAAMERRG